MSNSPDRKPGSKRRRLLKVRLAERDGAQCFYCETPFGPALEGATLDHLVPRSLLHTWAQAALVLACGPCNEAKADRLPQAVLRPESGRFGPGLVPLEEPNACRAYRVPRVPHARVREAEPSGQAAAAR